MPPLRFSQPLGTVRRQTPPSASSNSVGLFLLFSSRIAHGASTASSSLDHRAAVGATRRQEWACTPKQHECTARLLPLGADGPLNGLCDSSSQGLGMLASTQGSSATRHGMPRMQTAVHTYPYIVQAAGLRALRQIAGAGRRLFSHTRRPLGHEVQWPPMSHMPLHPEGGAHVPTLQAVRAPAARDKGPRLHATCSTRPPRPASNQGGMLYASWPLPFPAAA